MKQNLSKDIEPFKVRLVNTIYSLDFQQECMRWLYYYFSFFWIVMILFNIFVAYRFKNADLLVLCLLWLLLAWRNFKKGKEHNQLIKDMEVKKNGRNR